MTLLLRVMVKKSLEMLAFEGEKGGSMTRDLYFKKTTTVMIGLLGLMMVYLLSGLFRTVPLSLATEVIVDEGTLQSVLISLLSIVVSMVIVAVSGTLLAFKLCRRRGGFYSLLNGLIIMPLLFPPTVAGLVLLQGFGRYSTFSQVFFGGQLNMAFNFTAIVVTQVYITLPFFYQMTLNGFEDIDISYIEAAQVCGADQWVLLRAIMIPMSFKAMVAGIFMSALRGLSEFGATIMFAGNMAGKTQTMTTRIYQLYQTDMNAALGLAAFQLCIFLIPYCLFIGFRRKEL